MSFQEPMGLWPSLVPCAKSIILKQSGVKLHIYDAGPQDAPALLLVHGLGDEADSWRHIIQPLAVYQRVIAPDLPGFGRSEALPRYSITELIRVLLDLLETLNIPNATLLGSSLGGMLCHALAIIHPDRVRALVLLDGHLGMSRQKLNLGTLLFMVPGLGEWRYNHYRKNPQAAYNSLRPFYANLDSLPGDDLQFLFQRVNERVWSDKQRQAYLGILRSMAGWMAKHQHNLEAKLKHLDVPTLVIYGEHDHIVSPANTTALSELQPSARLVLLPGVGHLPHQEAPEALLECLHNDGRLGILLHTGVSQ